ncbi:Hypothetical lipoprotein precursor [Flavobacterium indicum GPTSA100-9 = DSM 17447]|uniref:Hypothetical lipoprotein n=1 Tax=Flavobacterium indicum (strain DSM 17447 / CIP 109464 / GPTSA100-9) TaxID=1094466 RepID=H8XP98_FLAIG|nr:hypothetical protein [Flavobacterium indicum]CCG53172.1 Hypothetical lipoprotein precursor [Flavobacterium indicum GPTSA100-9 = DSM 17447]
MTILFKFIFIFTSLFFLNSCGFSNTTNNTTVINKEFNSRYKESRKKITGKLSASEYTEMKTLLENELGKVISDKQNILINYDQKAPNCILLASSENNVVHVLRNRVRISDEISRKYNTIDFFVYNPNSYFADLYASDSFFKKDSGFFFTNIFTFHENCQAFYILKSNGEFLKFYGEDYFSEVKAFLEKNN